MSHDILVGTGFVGTALMRARRFVEVYNRTNIAELPGRTCDRMTIAAAPAEKWRANADPAGDMDGIRSMFDAVSRVAARRVVLISTVDALGDSAYGVNRLELEIMCRRRWPEALVIVRLPALFGPGLRKNALHDLLTGRPLSVSLDSVYQWYCIDWLADDLDMIPEMRAATAINIACPPVTLRQIVDRYGLRPAPPIHVVSSQPLPCPRYDVSEHGGYAYSLEAMWDAMDDFVAKWRAGGVRVA